DRELVREAALHPMYAKMIEKLETYQEDVLECETLVMATLLHPTFQMQFFTNCWPAKANDSKALLEQLFQKRKNKFVFFFPHPFVNGCGSLNPRKIEQCVISNVWLKEGIQVSGSFDIAQKKYQH
ncbi:hypothetical protein VP01_11064g1, partial [Puccinia sorghi]